MHSVACNGGHSGGEGCWTPLRSRFRPAWRRRGLSQRGRRLAVGRRAAWRGGRPALRGGHAAWSRRVRAGRGKRRQRNKSGRAERDGRNSKSAVCHGDLPSDARRGAPRGTPSPHLKRLSRATFPRKTATEQAVSTAIPFSLKGSHARRRRRALPANRLSANDVGRPNEAARSRDASCESRLAHMRAAAKAAHVAAAEAAEVASAEAAHVAAEAAARRSRPCGRSFRRRNGRLRR